MRGLTAAPLALAVLVVLEPWAESQAGSSTSQSLGLAAFGARLDGRTALLLVTEAGQGGSDLNGDGDALDLVPHVHDATSGTTTNLGLAVAPVSPGATVLAKGIVALKVKESDLGLDLNGDSDALDAVVHCYDVAADVLTNLGLATAGGVRTDGVRIAVAVEESDQGSADLNGDGDALDRVLYVYDVASGTTTNVGLALVGLPVLEGDAIAWLVNEAGQGATDLNGDGDIFDTIVHVHDIPSGTTTNLGLQSLATYAVGGHIVFTVQEYMQGFVDMNGDGDVDDEVLHIHDPTQGTTTSLGVAAGSQPSGSSSHLAFQVSENQQQADLNGDGDTLDNVQYVHDFASGATTNLGLAAFPPYLSVVEGRRLVWSVWEQDQGGADLNGDGDGIDEVVYFRDLVTGTTTNTGLAGAGGLVGPLVTFVVYENEQGGLDLNGDGDVADSVLHVIDLLTGTITNTGLAANKLWGNGNVLAFGIPESAQGGTDLNGDGDALDVVLHVWNAVRRTAENLGVADGVPSGNGAGDLDLAVALVSEALYGSDLNGDGDTLDEVPFLHRFDVPYGLTTDADRVQLSAGGTQSLTLDAGPDRAGDVHLVLGSLSGTSPGLPIGSHVLPLVWDAYSSFTLMNPNTFPLSDTFAILDGQGESAAAFTLPAGLDPALAGTFLYHAYLAFDLGTGKVEHASNAAGVELVP